MITTIRKWFWVWDFDKEEAWLNSMAKKGLALCNVGFCRYDFQESEPGEYTVRMDLPEDKGSREWQEYISFVEGTGAEHVGTVARWLYFRKKNDPDFNVYSDNASRIAMLNRIIQLCLAIGLFNFGIGVYNLSNYARFHLDVALIGLVSIALSLLIFYGASRLHAKRQKLKEAQELFE